MKAPGPSAMNAGASNGIELVEDELERVKAVLGWDGDQTR